MNAVVVVGVEGTLSSQDAVLWGAHAAAARGCSLQLVMAIGSSYGGLDSLWDDALLQGAQAILAAERHRVTAELPELEVRTAVDPDTPARALVRWGQAARLVVVGTHRMTPAERIFSGSLAYQVVAGAPCPVAVVPTIPDPPDDRVLVGVDGSGDSDAAVRAAVVEADRSGSRLVAVHVWQPPAMLATGTYLPGDVVTKIRDGEDRVLAETVAGIGADHPDLVVERHLVEGAPTPTLLHLAAGARLVVVGSHGRHGLARVLLGSVSHALVLHAPCPVLVVRA